MAPFTAGSLIRKSISSTGRASHHRCSSAASFADQAQPDRRARARFALVCVEQPTPDFALGPFPGYLNPAKLILLRIASSDCQHGSWIRESERSGPSESRSRAGVSRFDVGRNVMPGESKNQEKNISINCSVLPDADLARVRAHAWDGLGGHVDF